MLELGAALTSLLAALMADSTASVDIGNAARLFYASQGYRPAPWTKGQGMRFMLGKVTCPNSHEGPFKVVGISWTDLEVEFQRKIGHGGKPYMSRTEQSESYPDRSDAPDIYICKTCGIQFDIPSELPFEWE